MNVSLLGGIKIVQIRQVAEHQGDSVATPRDETVWEITLSNLERVYSHDLTLCSQKAMEQMKIVVRPRECATRLDFVGEPAEIPEVTECRNDQEDTTPFKWVVVLSNQRKFFGDDLAAIINVAIDSLRRRPLPPNICMIQDIVENPGYRNHTLRFRGRNVGLIVYDAEKYKVGDLVVVGQGHRGVRHLDQEERDQLLERERREGKLSP